MGLKLTDAAELAGPAGLAAALEGLLAAAMNTPGQRDAPVASWPFPVRKKKPFCSTYTVG